MGKMAPRHAAFREHLMMEWDHNRNWEVAWGLGQACCFAEKP